MFRTAVDRFLNEISRWRSVEVSPRRALRKQIDRGVLQIGEGTYGHPRIFHWGEPTVVKIGSYCSIAPDVTIYAGGEHRVDWVSTFPFMEFPEQYPSCSGTPGHPATKGDVRIGSDVWIGHGVTILSGVNIGTGAVIGAGSVVTSSVNAYAIAAGVPARTLKYRFPVETQRRLLESKWWEFSPEIVGRIAPLLLHEPDRPTLDELDRLAEKHRRDALGGESKH